MQINRSPRVTDYCHGEDVADGFAKDPPTWLQQPLP
jgi:hypothetical protein